MEDLFKVVLIETKNTCSRKCWFCKFGQDRSDKSIRKMDWNTILKIIRNLSSIEFTGRISWYGINEPLLEKRLLEIIRLTKTNCNKSFLTLNTNGDLLTENIYWKLRNNGLDALGVSVYDDKIFQKIKQMQVDENLVIIDMRHPKFGDLENRGGNIQKNTFIFEKEKNIYLNNSCDRPFKMLNIKSTGDIVLCCADLYGDVVIGSVIEDRLENIWNSPVFQYYRTLLKKEGRRNLPLCRNCSHDGSSSPILYPIEQGRS